MWEFMLVRGEGSGAQTGGHSGVNENDSIKGEWGDEQWKPAFQVPCWFGEVWLQC